MCLPNKFVLEDQDKQLIGGFKCQENGQQTFKSNNLRINEPVSHDKAIQLDFNMKITK